MPVVVSLYSCNCATENAPFCAAPAQPFVEGDANRSNGLTVKIISRYIVIGVCGACGALRGKDAREDPETQR